MYPSIMPASPKNSFRNPCKTLRPKLRANRTALDFKKMTPESKPLHVGRGHAISALFEIIDDNPNASLKEIEQMAKVHGLAVTASTVASANSSFRAVTRHHKRRGRLQ